MMLGLVLRFMINYLRIEGTILLLVFCLSFMLCARGKVVGMGDEGRVKISNDLDEIKGGMNKRIDIRFQIDCKCARLMLWSSNN
jgi:hypothetical protein